MKTTWFRWFLPVYPLFLSLLLPLADSMLAKQLQRHTYTGLTAVLLLGYLLYALLFFFLWLHFCILHLCVLFLCILYLCVLFLFYVLLRVCFPAWHSLLLTFRQPDGYGLCYLCLYPAVPYTYPNPVPYACLLNASDSLSPRIRYESVAAAELF